MSEAYLVLTIVLVVLSSASLTEAIRSRAVILGLVDVPNSRSSHSVPTPRGGGVAIVLSFVVGLTIAAFFAVISWNFFASLVGGGCGVALVGFLDDRWSLSPKVRILVHFLAAASALLLSFGVAPLRVGGQFIEFGPIGYAIAAIAIVWTINLFNFMDGIDGLAASEALCVTLGAAALQVAARGVFMSELLVASLLVGAASFGFLVWNWPPAKIFMGDAGSGFLGFVVPVLAIFALRENSIALFQWLILGGIFFVDATVTLIRRLVRGEKPQVAHRTHAYQWLARRWGSHLRVTLAVCAVNVGWLLPCAYAAQVWPEKAPHILIAALLPLVVVTVLAGAGRAEIPSEN